jgi:hypothetical protein
MHRRISKISAIVITLSGGFVTMSTTPSAADEVEQIEIIGQRFCTRYPQHQECGGPGYGGGGGEPGSGIEATQAYQKTKEEIKEMIDEIISSYKAPCVKPGESQNAYMARGQQDCLSYIKDRIGSALFNTGVVRAAAVVSCSAQNPKFIDTYIAQPDTTCK